MDSVSSCNILPFFGNQCYFLCALSSTTPSLTNLTAHPFSFSLPTPAIQHTHSPWLAEPFYSNLLDSPPFHSAAFDYDNLVTLVSTASLLPIRICSRLVPLRTRAPPCLQPWGRVSRSAQACPTSRFMTHIYPNSLAMPVASAAPSLNPIVYYVRALPPPLPLPLPPTPPPHRSAPSTFPLVEALRWP